MPSLIDHIARVCLRLTRRVGAFRGHRSGNVAVIFALSIVPVILAVGGAVDFTTAVTARNQLQDTADSAALAAAGAANSYLTANGSSAAQVAAATQLATATSQNFVNANANASLLTGAPTVTVATVMNASVATVNVTVQANVKPAFLQLAGITNIPLTLTSKTTMTPGTKYYQVIFVIDVSNSMGIGGTAAAITALQNNSQIGCAFACHDPNSYSAATTSCLAAGFYSRQTSWPFSQVWNLPVNNCDKRAIAKADNILLKIDYVNQAVQSFISQLSSYAGSSPSHFSVGIDTYGSTFNQALAPTPNMTTAQTAASTIDVENAQPLAPSNYGYTYTANGLTSALQTLTNVGDGSSATKMLTYVVFLSDAVQDVPGASQWGRVTNLGYTAQCTALKAAGVNVFSIWAPYYAITGDSQYDTLVAPMTSQLGPTMQGCASNSGQYFQANDGPAIQSAVNSTFNIIIANANLRIQQ
jgi:Flp pilus assembly protein TadG